MATHISVLPLDVLNTLSVHLNDDSVPVDGTGTRFIRLPHPRTGIPSLFLLHMRTQKGNSALSEVQIVSPAASRSWFMGEGEVIGDGKLVVMSPIDIAFILIPILQAIMPSDGSAGNFRTLDDMFEEASVKLATRKDKHMDAKDLTLTILAADISTLCELNCTQDALKRVCEFKDIGPELTVYRFSRIKLVDYLMKKVNRLSKPKILEKSRTLLRVLAKDGLLEDGKEDLLEAGRIKVACDLISQYLPQDLYVELQSKYDFTALNAHVHSIQDEATAVTAPDLVSNNGGNVDIKDECQEGKKRKSLAQPSQGVEKLKRANINGMAKISSFFEKPLISRT